MSFESKTFELRKIHPNVSNLINKVTNKVVDNVVVKSYTKQRHLDREVSNLRKLSTLKVPHVIAVQGLHVIMKKIPGHDLMDWMINHHHHFTENEIRKIIIQVLEIIRDMHSYGVVHRDIKPENIIYNRDTGDVTLIDFDQKLTSKHTAPENLNEVGLYAETADAWGVGVVCYNLITRMYPWRKDTDIVKKKYFKIYNKCSAEFLDFIDRLLIIDPSKRMTIDEALQHLWLKKSNEKNIT